MIRRNMENGLGINELITFGVMYMAGASILGLTGVTWTLIWRISSNFKCGPEMVSDSVGIDKSDEILSIF